MCRINGFQSVHSNHDKECTLVATTATLTKKLDSTVFHVYTEFKHMSSAHIFQPRFPSSLALLTRRIGQTSRPFMGTTQYTSKLHCNCCMTKIPTIAILSTEAHMLSVEQTVREQRIGSTINSAVQKNIFSIGISPFPAFAATLHGPLASLASLPNDMHNDGLTWRTPFQEVVAAVQSADVHSSSYR